MSNPFEHEKRRWMSPRRVAQIFARDGGRCQGPCQRKLGPSDGYDLDHKIALELGGTDDDENLQILCDMCHALKTKNDHGEAGHIRRAYTNHVVPARFRRSKSWSKRW